MEFTDNTASQLPEIVVKPEASIDPNVESVNTATIDPNMPSSAPVMPEVADKRAAKAVYGLDQDVIEKPHPEVANTIASGGEDALRKEVAGKQDFKRSIQLQQEIFKVANTKNGPLSPADINYITNNFKPSDPDSVFEDQFSAKYMQNLFMANKLNSVEKPYTWLDSALAEMPDHVQDTFNRASTSISKYQFALKKEQDLEAQVEGESFFPYVGHMLHASIPGISSAYLRGRDIPFFSEGFLGEHLEAERQALYKLPYDEYKARLTQLLDRLSEENPHLALRFARAMRGQSIDESTINSQFELLDLSAIPGVAKGLGAVGREALTRRANLYNQTNNAARKMITGVADMDSLKVVDRDGATVFDSAGNPIVKPAEPINVVAPTMAGDIGEAGVQKSTSTLVGKLNGTHDPAKEAIEALTSNFRVDKETNITNPGRYGQEVAIRLNAQIDAGIGKITEAIDNAFKVNRTPALIASEDQVRAVKTRMEALHRGIDNAVLDISDPIYNPVMNTYHHEIYLGTPDGDLFPSRSTALNNAVKVNGMVLQPTVSAKINAVNQEVGVVNKLVKNAQAKLDVAIANAADVDLPAKTRRYNEKQVINLRQELDRHNSKLAELRLQREETLTRNRGRAGKDPALGEQGVTIEQHGVGYYIKVHTKQLDETQKLVRDGLITLPQTSTREYRKAVQSGEVSTSIPPSWFGGWVNATVGIGRTPEETLSITENAMRKIATHGPSVLLKTVQELAEPITKLPKFAQDENKLILRKNWEQFDRFIKAGQKEIDPTTGTPGRFFNTPEMTDFYMRTFGRQPTVGELEANTAYKQLVEFTRILRSMADYRNKARVGTESHSIYTRDGEGNKIKSDFFDAVARPDFPTGDGVVMVVGDRPGNERLFRANSSTISTNSNYGKQLREDVKQGQAKVLEVYNTERRPLDGFSKKVRDSNAFVQYVIVRSGNVETKPIAWDSAPRRRGGDMVPDSPYAIKLPDIQTERVGKIVNRYHGDITIAGVANRTVGDNIAKLWNEFHALVRSGDEAAARAFSEANFDIGGSKHLSWYKPTTGPNGETIQPWLNANHEVRVVQKGEQIIDLDRRLQDKFEFTRPSGLTQTTFFDATKFGSLARRTQEEMYGHQDARELFSINDRGTNGNPLYNYEPSNLLDPITAVNRGLNKAIHGAYMDDIKISAAEHWVKQAAPYLNASPSDLATSPMYYFFHGEFKPGSGNKKEVFTLQGNRKKIRDFMGVPTVVDNAVQYVSQATAEIVYKGTKVDIKPVTELHLVRDPVTFARNMAVTAKLGLWSIPQLVTQAITFGNIMAISPRHSYTAITAGILMPWYHNSARTPGILNHLDKLASTVSIPGMARFRPGDFAEATKAMYQGGFINVGREHMLSDNPTGNKVIRSGTDQFLDMGMLPFRVGSQVTRVAAWYTAYTEAREVKPTGAFSRQEWANIQARASLLDHNQSRASSSVLHTGALSIPATFASYPLRVAEMISGKQLTIPEKARVFGYNSLMFGIPVGGLGLLGFPIGDYLYKKALENDYVMGDNLVVTTAMEGVGALVLAAITGGGDPRKGNWYNVNKYASKGIGPLETMLDQDATFLKVITGAPGDILKKSWDNSSSMRMWMGSMLRQDAPNDPKAFNLKLEHLTKVFREITILDKTLTVAAAVNIGDWMNKNGVKLENDVSPANAIFMGLSGLSNQRISSAYLKNEITQEQRQLQTKAINGYIEEFQKGMRADAIKDHEQAIDYFKNAFAYLAIGKVPEDRMPQINARLFKGNEDFITNAEHKFYTSNLPNAEKFNKMLTYQKQAIIDKQRRN